MENVRSNKAEEKVEDLSQGRKIVVIDNDNNAYSLRVPNLKELNESKLAKTRYYNKLLRAKDDEGNNLYSTKEELRELHKSRGIDVDKFREEIKVISLELNKELLELAGIMNKEDIDKQVIVLKDKILSYRKKINTLLGQEGKLYVNSIESLVEEKYNYYLMIQVIDIKKVSEDTETEELWERLFKTTDELEADKRAEHFVREFLDFYYGYTSDMENESPLE